MVSIAKPLTHAATAVVLLLAGCRTPSTGPEPAPEAARVDAGTVGADLLERAHPDDLRLVTYNVWFKPRRCPARGPCAAPSGSAWRGPRTTPWE